MKLAVVKETKANENRVAAIPETVKKLAALGFEVTVEKGAGESAAYTDKMYQDAGARIAGSVGEALGSADVVFKVQPPTDSELAAMKKGAALAALLQPYQAGAALKSYAEKGITSFSMELMPRITRAQSMDVLSSQSNLAGYKAVLEAANHFSRAFPMMMTAAGTIPPARVFIMGVGVAGLQAIATARRLGATVSATDVRPSTKEQVQSLGATFVMVEDEETKQAETSGGYAKEMSEEYKKKQAALIAETITKQDIVITTALIPGRAAPVLVTEEMVKTMKPGSVIIDMAVEQGGNCPLSRMGETVQAHNVKIIGFANIPARIATDASALYARNLYNFIAAFFDKEKKALNIDFADDIIKGITLTHDGKLTHPNFGGSSI